MPINEESMPYADEFHFPMHNPFASVTSPRAGGNAGDEPGPEDRPGDAGPGDE